jgi:hypothetical protein
VNGILDPIRPLRPARFRIDALEEDIFEGYTQGDTWNGWACPYFTVRQAFALTTAWNLTYGSGTAYYDASQRHFVFDYSGDPDDCEAFPPVRRADTGEETLLWPIGAFCWVWEEVTGDEVPGM